ncbi:hypothetical protein PO124_09905 [Bacillus licheniformis]|nr:hypothetical protein [Bacillus licheniformis]
MERRYELFAHSGVREIERFNEKSGNRTWVKTSLSCCRD